MKRDDIDAGSNVADSRLGSSGNAPSRQEEPKVAEPVARNVDVKQEIHEAGVDRINIDLLAEDTAREAAKFKQSDSSLDAISSSSKPEDPPLAGVPTTPVAAGKTPLSFAKKTTEKYKIANVVNYKDEVLQTTPYPVVAQRSGNIKFPLRKRGEFCFTCGKKEESGELVKCVEDNCEVVYHAECVESLPSYCYDQGVLFRKGPTKLTCPLHHCNGCYNKVSRAGGSNGPLVVCSQCELAWHDDCMPAGCERTVRGEVMCPRHRSFPTEPHCHIIHCAYCQKRGFFRSILQHRPRTFPFCANRYRTEYSTMRLPNSRAWYPCTIVDTTDYQHQNDPNLGKLGYVAVQWLPWREKTYHSLLPYNRIIPMRERDYFFEVLGDSYECFEEWKELQEQVKKMSYILTNRGQVAGGTSNIRN